MIRSAYDYGAAILTTIPKSRLDKLEQIQNQVLRSILGGFKSTPKVLLNIETGIYPVKDRWNLLAYNYLLRLNGKTWNPAYETIHQLTKQVPTWKTKSTPAVILHIRKLDPTGKKLFRNPPSQTPVVEPLPPWKHFDIPSNYFPLPKKLARDSNDSNQLFNLLMSNQDPNSLEIYTDGSVCKKTKTASCAFHIPKKKVGEAWLLENFTNSFNAELHAIRQALYHLNNYEIDAVTIFTDSKSSIQAITNFKWHSSPVIPEILQQIINLKSAGIMITLTWIPSHVGIRGNDIADQLATYVRKVQPSTYTKTMLNHRSITFNKLLPQSTNMAVVNRKGFGFLPWHTNKRRSIQTALFRLRSGHNKLNHFMSRIDSNIHGECPNGCCEREDATHILLHCPYYSVERAEMQQSLSLHNIPLVVPTLLGLNSLLPKHTQNKIVSNLITFLLKTKLIERV